MGRMEQLGELQLAILRVLWKKGEATVVEVHEALRDDRQIAPTTVSTMLVGLEKRGLVDHRNEGRKYVYCALVEQGETQVRLVQELVDRVFEGNHTALVNHLLGTARIDDEQLSRLRQKVARREAEDFAAEGSLSEGPDAKDREQSP